MSDTKEILYAKWRATAREFGRGVLKRAQIIGATDGMDNLADGMFVNVPTVAIHTLSNVPHSVARYFEDVEVSV